jgi:hypothetical protein
MAYSAEISRENPTLIVFLIDQSTSMRNRIEGGGSKASTVSDILNRTIYSMIVRCSRSDGVRDYFALAVVGYSRSEARNSWEGTLRQAPLHPISHVASNPLRIETRLQKFVGATDRLEERQVKFPVWIEPRSAGNTSMCSGLIKVKQLLTDWCFSHKRSFPPTVIHLTDGHPTDGDPEPLGQEIFAIATNDGQTLCLNVHIEAGGGDPILYPADQTSLPDRYSAKLFRMSSPLPRHMISVLTQKGVPIRPGSKAFVFNADLQAIVDMFDIGTRPANLTDR